ncbi:MAG: SagB/ThcOx family dehydrogenase [Acidobacteriota bacterium]
MPDRDPLAAVYAYHDQSKHRVDRYARSAGFLDWATQPDSFRTFRGAQRIDLVEPFCGAAGGPRAEPLRTHPSSPDAAPLPSSPWSGLGTALSYDALLAPSGPRVAPGLAAVSVFFRYSLGLSAWKQAGAVRWALRVNPSSGNLHPTEGYALLGPGVVGGSPGVYHYAPDAHALEQRCLFPSEAWRAGMRTMPDGAFLAGLTSIHWREAWKYGERAFRYCQHDVGHAMAAMRMAAALMGWRLRAVSSGASDSMAALLGTDRADDFGEAEREEPACLCIVWPGSGRCDDPADLHALADAVAKGAWSGRAKALSPSRVQWDAIDAVADATRLPVATWLPAVPRQVAAAAAAAAAAPAPSLADRPAPYPALSASALLLQRRSAVAMDAERSIDRDRFLFILRRLMPGGHPPWDALWWEPRVHLILFVHRVEGLEPGLYAFARTPRAAAAMQRQFRSDFAWVRPAAVDEQMPLYLLERFDARRLSQQLSCGQTIASDGFFSAGLLAEFDEALEAHGPSFYRHLFWEAGMLGQMLYLEAEAAGARGTGIGCFFDDAVHDVLGVKAHAFQSLYHFTVGMPVDDPRLQSSPGYAWEAGA